MVTRALALGFALAVAGCGGAAHVGPATGPSCNGVNSGVTFCFEVVSGAADPTSFQNACGQLTGTVSTPPCNRVGVVGGCQTTSNGIVLVTWFYSSNATVSSVQQACQQNNEPFVLP
jgi:hypothetical protein